MKELNKNTVKIDKIIIGSSPYSIYEALSTSNKNKTKIIEKSNNIGGSWALTNTAKYKNLEIAPHILPGREINTLSKFEKLNQTKLENMEPQPICVYSNRIFKYNNIPFVLYEIEKLFNIFLSVFNQKTDFIEHTLYGSFVNKSKYNVIKNSIYFIYQYLKEEIIIQSKNFITKVLKIKKIGNYQINYVESYKYPKNGSKEFTNLLIKKIKNKKNVSISNNEEVKSAYINNNQDIVIKTKNISYKCKNLVITNQTYFEKVYINNKLIQIDYTEQKIGLFYLILEDTSAKTFTYIHTFDKNIMRLSDISDYTEYNHNTNKARILTVQISPKKIYQINKNNEKINYKDLAEYTHQLLLNTNLVSTKSKIIKIIPNSYNITSIDWNKTELKNFKNIKIINNKNLTNAIVGNYNNWIR
tara:strand:+ start:470 stop:1711 length:1242 start_codon:yes stop_codon:yes gene_type:complete